LQIHNILLIDFKKQSIPEIKSNQKNLNLYSNPVCFLYVFNDKFK